MPQLTFRNWYGETKGSTRSASRVLIKIKAAAVRERDLPSNVQPEP
jgi:hypothetical protein